MRLIREATALLLAMSHCLPLTRKISDGANSHCEASRLLNRLAQLGGQQHAPDGLWISRVCAVENGACREFTPVLAKHTKSFSLIECIPVGFDRTSELRADSKASRSMREKGIDGRHQQGG
jgi:hypothetical protein